MARTEISTLGEFGLIKHLTKDIEVKNESTVKGVGDDCAILDYGKKLTLVTTDLLLEGIHFDLTYTPLKHLGYKAVMVNLSDIYAMYGTPKQIKRGSGIPEIPRGGGGGKAFPPSCQGPTTELRTQKSGRIPPPPPPPLPFPPLGVSNTPPPP